MSLVNVYMKIVLLIILALWGCFNLHQNYRLVLMDKVSLSAILLFCFSPCVKKYLVIKLFLRNCNYSDQVSCTLASIQPSVYKSNMAAVRISLTFLKI